MRVPLEPHLPNLYAGILVGGASRRMGRPKALLELDGQPLWRRIADTLARHVEAVFLLGCLDGETAGIERIADRAGIGGPLAGLLGAFDAHPTAAWLLAACDQPRIESAAIAWLISQRGPRTIAVVPRSANGLETMLAIYEPSARPVLEEIARYGRTSLQRLSEVPGTRTPTLPDALRASWRDVDTPEDWARLHET